MNGMEMAMGFTEFVLMRHPRSRVIMSMMPDECIPSLVERIEAAGIRPDHEALCNLMRATSADRIADMEYLLIFLNVRRAIGFVEKDYGRVKGYSPEEVLGAARASLATSLAIMKDFLSTPTAV